MDQIVRHTYGLTDQERADLIRALKDAQNELCCGPGFPEANGFWERWERLIDRFEDRLP